MGSQKRLHTRMKFHFSCLLMGRDGNTYDALIGNISLGGALIRVNSDTHLQVGDMCEIVFSEKPALFPLKRTGKIVRLDSERNMGVSFLNHIGLKETLRAHLKLNLIQRC
jgi:hypothetical protein